MHPGALFLKCPSCGSEADEVGEKEKFLCTSCDFEYFYNPAPATAAIITNEHRQVLLVRRGKDPYKGKLDLPGGFVDIGEGAVESLQRELEEELQASISDITLYTTGPDVYTYNGVTYAILNLVFTAHLRGDIGRLQEEEIEEYLFMDIEEINPDDIAFEFLQIAMRTYIEEHRTS